MFDLQLKLQTVQLESQREKISQLERDLNSRDEILSQRITDALHEGKVSSVLYSPTESSKSDKDSLTLAETKARMLEYEKLSINGDLKVSLGKMGLKIWKGGRIPQFVSHPMHESSWMRMEEITSCKSHITSVSLTDLCIMVKK